MGGQPLGRRTPPHPRPHDQLQVGDCSFSEALGATVLSLRALDQLKAERLGILLEIGRCLTVAQASLKHSTVLPDPVSYSPRLPQNSLCS